MAVDVGLRRGGRHQRHVVERRQQDPAVERVEVDVAVERLVARGGGLRAGARPLGVEEVLDAAAEPGHVPRQRVLVDHLLDAGLEALAERDHARERLLGQHLGERRAHRGERQHVGGQRAADPADVGDLVGDRGLDALRHLGGEAVGRGGHAAGERLADRQQVGLEAVRGGVAAGPRGDRVRLVDDQQRAGGAGRGAQRVVVAGLGQHDADVGQRRLGEHARDVAVGELALERLDVVELDDARRLRRRHRRADVALARDAPRRRRRASRTSRRPCRGSTS